MQNEEIKEVSAAGAETRSHLLQIHGISAKTYQSSFKHMITLCTATLAITLVYAPGWLAVASSGSKALCAIAVIIVSASLLWALLGMLKVGDLVQAGLMLAISKDDEQNGKLVSEIEQTTLQLSHYNRWTTLCYLGAMICAVLTFLSLMFPEP